MAIVSSIADAHAPRRRGVRGGGRRARSQRGGADSQKPPPATAAAASMLPRELRRLAALEQELAECKAKAAVKDAATAAKTERAYGQIATLKREKKKLETAAKEAAKEAAQKRANVIPRAAAAVKPPPQIETMTTHLSTLAATMQQMQTQMQQMQETQERMMRPRRGWSPSGPSGYRGGHRPTYRERRGTDNREGRQHYHRGVQDTIARGVTPAVMAAALGDAEDAYFHTGLQARGDDEDAYFHTGY